MRTLCIGATINLLNSGCLSEVNQLLTTSTGFVCFFATSTVFVQVIISPSQINWQLADSSLFLLISWNTVGWHLKAGGASFNPFISLGDIFYFKTEIHLIRTVQERVLGSKEDSAILAISLTIVPNYPTWSSRTCTECHQLRSFG